MLDFHVATQVALQVEFAGAVRTLEGLAAGVKVHVSQEVVHSVERLAAHLRTNKYKNTVRHTHTHTDFHTCTKTQRHGCQTRRCVRKKVKGSFPLLL